MPRMVNGPKVRERGPDDEYSQATLFWNSVSEVERDHIVDAYTFELGKVDIPAVVERMVTRLALVDTTLAARVCFGLGLPAPAAPSTPANDSPDAVSMPDLPPSPALAMVSDNVYPVDGRVVHILANDGADIAGIRSLKDALTQAGATPHVIATHKGAIAGGGRRPDELTVDRSFHTSSSAECDGLVIAGGAGLAANPAVLTYVQSAYRHYKTIAAWGDGTELLQRAGLGLDEPGVLVSDRSSRAFAKDLVAALSVHRHWERAAPHPTLAILTSATELSHV
jgi:catalase